MDQYQKACAAGQRAEARKLADKALAINPACLWQETQ